MKYLFLLALALVMVWLWRSNRRSEQLDRREREAAAKPATRSGQQATEIVACALCTLHLPRPDALSGKRGLYCCEAHRRQAEG
jgi:uncharacterized protein